MTVTRLMSKEDRHVIGDDKGNVSVANYQKENRLPVWEVSGHFVKTYRRFYTSLGVVAARFDVRGFWVVISNRPLSASPRADSGLKNLPRRQVRETPNTVAYDS